MPDVNIEYNYENSILMNDLTEEDYIHPDFDAIVKSILVSRAKDGTTIEEIREDYYNLIGEKFPYFENTTERLLKLPNVMCTTNENGTRIFNILSSEKTQHIITMVQNQKPHKSNNGYNKKSNYNNNNNMNYHNHNYQYHNNQYNNNNYNKKNNYNETSSWRSNNRSTPIENNNYFGTDTEYNQKYLVNGTNTKQDNCFYEDNYQYLSKFVHGSCETLNSKYSKGLSDWSRNSNSSNQYFSPENEESAHIYDYQLMGDDFLLAMAKMELGCRYKTENGVQQSGLCISGQNITESINRIQTIEKINRRLIVNIGSVDILQGRHLIEIQHNFINLLKLFESRGIRPILTTLAPLANHGHRPEVKRILERFNDFIRNLGLPYIDIWKSMVNEFGNTLYDCYQSGARHVTGSNHPHVFWNKIGRQRILNSIKSDLEYFPLIDSNFNLMLI